jgi:hypothetical protein
MLPYATQKGVQRFDMSPGVKDMLLTTIKDKQSMGEKY